MNLVEMIKTDKDLKAQFDRVVALEELADSIDYVGQETVTQEEIDDHTLVNGQFIRAIQTLGLTSAQYYEVKKVIS